MSEVWKFLKETLPKYQWAEEKVKQAVEEDFSANQVVILTYRINTSFIWNKRIHLWKEASESKEDASLDKDAKNDLKNPKGKPKGLFRISN